MATLAFLYLLAGTRSSQFSDRSLTMPIPDLNDLTKEIRGLLNTLRCILQKGHHLVKPDVVLLSSNDPQLDSCISSTPNNPVYPGTQDAGTIPTSAMLHDSLLQL